VRRIAGGCWFMISLLPCPYMIGAAMKSRRHATRAGLPIDAECTGRLAGELRSVALLGQDQLSEARLTQEVDRLIVQDRQLRRAGE
jgi:hypothetical protein